MKVPKIILLYSVNTWLAYAIAERYYEQNHYVWCTVAFDPEEEQKSGIVIPPTSSPKDIYRNLAEEVRRGDKHSAKIKENKEKIIKGAAFKKNEGIINNKKEKEIIKIVNNIELKWFRPVLYVIPFVSVSKILEEVPIEERAHELSLEYRIKRLPRNCFHVVEF